MKTLRTAGEALLSAITYGDAAGLPVETQQADQIRERNGEIGKLRSGDGLWGVYGSPW